MSTTVQIVLMAIVSAVLAAGPLVMQGASPKVAAWAGVVAAATYIKGKYEQTPGGK